MNSASGFRYIPALDGMRALAVLGVLLYHADVAWLPGGFLGVELFFVVSGYLITSLLLSERARSGHTDLIGFWKRRAQRLFPALWALLLLVPIYAALALPEELYGLRHDVGAALLYATNWQLITSEQSYFEQMGRPSPLQHLWSLAVEEQFYLLWPLLFSTVLAKRKPRSAVLGLLLAAAASAIWMGHLYDPNQDPSRVYYGSDTRAFGLLLGATLAFALAGSPLGISARLNALLSGASLLTLGLVFAGLDELNPRVYPLGFLMVGCATCALIATCAQAQPSGPGRLLTARALVALGKRSYSLYLWHWPVFVITRPGLDTQLSGTTLLLVRLGLTLLLAEASYRCVECPLRRSWKWPSWSREPSGAHPRFRFSPSLLAALLLVSFSARALIFAQQPLAEELTLAAPPDSAHTATVEQLHDDSSLLRSQTGPRASALGSQTGPRASALRAQTGPRASTARVDSSLREGDPLALTSQPERRVLAIGDSVMLGARRYLHSADAQLEVEVDAEVGRTPVGTLELLTQRKTTLTQAHVVIIHLGNNGPFQAEQFDRMAELLAAVPHVVFVTAKVPRRLGVLNNRTIREGVKRHPQLALVDWYEASKDHAEWFREDGLHLRESGATEYARLLAQHYFSDAAR